MGIEKRNKLAVAYLRVSTKQQKYGEQREVVKDWADARDIILAEVFEEKISGRVVDRPEFVKMLEYVENKGIDTVLCANIDRFSRTDWQTIRFIEDLAENNLEFCAVRDGVYIPQDPPRAQIFLAKQMALFATFNYETLRINMKRGFEKRMGEQLAGIPPPKGKKRIGAIAREFSKVELELIDGWLSDDDPPSLAQMAAYLKISDSTFRRAFERKQREQEDKGLPMWEKPYKRGRRKRSPWPTKLAKARGEI